MFYHSKYATQIKRISCFLYDKYIIQTCFVFLSWNAFLRANVSMHQTNSGKSPKFVFTPTFIFCSPICSYNGREQLQNTPQLIYMSLNKNSVYCVMPRSSKPPDTCKWGGPKLRGILKFSQWKCSFFLWKYILGFEKWLFSFDRSNMQIFTVDITEVVWPHVTNVLDLRYFCEPNPPCTFHSRYQVKFAGLWVRLKIEQHKCTRKFLQ